MSFRLNNEKGKRVIGLKYKSLKETFMETLADFEERGWMTKED
jgi:hypothetical protein